jgi:serine protease Do
MNRRSLTILASAVFLLASPLGAQQLEGQYRVIGSAVRAAFDPVRDVLQTSSAVLYFERRPFGFGAVMSEDGYIFAKASELEGRKGFSVRIDAEEYSNVTVVATDFDWDVALLKVSAEGLIPVRWMDDAEVTRGTWVVSNGATSRTRRRVRPGIISASTRSIGGESQVVLGVVLKLEDEQVIIGKITEDSGANGVLEEGDLLLEAEGEKVKTRDDLLACLKGKAPGDILRVKVRRDEEELDLEIPLMDRNKVKDFANPESRNDRMSGPVSKRRTNFERVLQHDTMLSERTVGGPLLDLDGRGVGLNIAYANRSEAFAIPAKDVVVLFEELKEKAEE